MGDGHFRQSRFFADNCRGPLRSFATIAAFRWGPRRHPLPERHPTALQADCREVVFTVLLRRQTRNVQRCLTCFLWVWTIAATARQRQWADDPIAPASRRQPVGPAWAGFCD